MRAVARDRREHERFVRCRRGGRIDRPARLEGGAVGLPGRRPVGKVCGVGMRSGVGRIGLFGAGGLGSAGRGVGFRLAFGLGHLAFGLGLRYRRGRGMLLGRSRHRGQARSGVGRAGGDDADRILITVQPLAGGKEGRGAAGLAEERLAGELAGLGDRDEAQRVEAMRLGEILGLAQGEAGDDRDLHAPALA